MTSDKELIRSDIESYLGRYQGKELLRFVAVGSVDENAAAQARGRAARAVKRHRAGIG